MLEQYIGRLWPIYPNFSHSAMIPAKEIRSKDIQRWVTLTTLLT